MLLAAELNSRMEDLLHGDNRWLTGLAVTKPAAPAGGGVSSEEEERHLEACFTAVDDLKRYVGAEILAGEPPRL